MLFLSLLLLAAAPPPRLLDDFEDIATWKSTPSDGVSLALSQAPGVSGQALRLDFDFHGGAGYAVARKELAFDLPENYEISFRVRAEAPVNNFEVKLIDPTNEDVWWVNRRSFEFPREWTRIRLKKRHISFAWGPAGGGEIKKVAALELAVTAGTGGKGYVLLDDLTLTELPPPHPYDRTPRVTTAPDGIALDFLEDREFGGLVIDWGTGPFASRYEVQISDDGADWKPVHTVEGGNGGRDSVYLPETESRHLRLRFPEGSGNPRIDVKPLEFSASPNAFFAEIAGNAPRGLYPRATSGEMVYWTIVGVSGDKEEGLFDEDGRLETGKGGFSVEPFLWMDDRLITWNDVKATQSLRDGYLPIPTVTWEAQNISLWITAFASGEPGASTLHTQYQIENRSKAEIRPRLFLAIRPFQVNPPSQFLNTQGGVAKIQEITWDGRAVTVDGKQVIPSIPPSGFGAATFDQGEIGEHLARGRLPEGTRVADPQGWASGALAWDLRLGPGGSAEISVAIPLSGSQKEEQETVPEAWKEELNRTEIRLPTAALALAQTLKTTLAYILINRDGPAIQPGSRSYERSWIRDGALTSTALLRLGHEKEVREFIEWFAPYQFANGKVPCCVDSRGADPVPENDSHGELIHLITEYFRFTGDRDLALRMWPHVEKAVAYMDSLRQTRRTAEYKTPEKLPYFGLLPESISHEGYSDKPVHSYWDDFFALRGLKDAALLARALGKEADRYAAMRDEFQKDFHASLRRTIALHRIGYIPGSVEKGDFDPTSTSIGLAPGGEMERLPRMELRYTFERYWDESLARKEGRREWEAYTPYELRNVRTFLRLGWTDRAHELLGFFMADRRPAAWNQWAEVVWRDPRTPKFIGDMPHTWVGSDFLHAVLDFFAYVRESDEALVLGAGILPEWTRGEGVAVRDLRTEYGPLSYTAKQVGETIRFEIAAGLTVPPGGIAVRQGEKEIIVRRLPATVDLIQRKPHDS